MPLPRLAIIRIHRGHLYSDSTFESNISSKKNGACTVQLSFGWPTLNLLLQRILSAPQNFFLSLELLDTFSLAMHETVAHRLLFQTHNSSSVRGTIIYSLLVKKNLKKCLKQLYTQCI